MQPAIPMGLAKHLNTGGGGYKQIDLLEIFSWVLKSDPKLRFDPSDLPFSFQLIGNTSASAHGLLAPPCFL